MVPAHHDRAGPEHGRAGAMSQIMNVWFFLSVVAICITILLSQWVRS
jgi:hypothetical protein